MELSEILDMRYIKNILSKDLQDVKHPRVIGFREATKYVRGDWSEMRGSSIVVPHPIYVSNPQAYLDWLSGDEYAELEVMMESLKAFEKIRKNNPEEGVAVRSYIVGRKESHLPGYRSSCIFDKEKLPRAVKSVFQQASNYEDIVQQTGIIMHPFKNPGINPSGEVITSCSKDRRVSRVAVVPGCAEGAHKIPEVPEYLVLFQKRGMSLDSAHAETKVLEYKKPKLDRVYVVNSDQLEIGMKKIDTEKTKSISLRGILRLCEELKGLEAHMDKPQIVEFTITSNDQLNLIDFRDVDPQNPLHGVYLEVGTAEEFIQEYTGKTSRELFRKNGREFFEESFDMYWETPSLY